MSTQAEQLENTPIVGTETTPMRFVTAASLFDGHDAAINVMRRLIQAEGVDRKSTRLNSSHDQISYAVFCLKKKK